MEGPSGSPCGAVVCSLFFAFGRQSHVGYVVTLGEAQEDRFNLLQMIPWLLFLSLAIWFWLDRRKSDLAGRSVTA